MHNPDYVPVNNFVQVQFGERFLPINEQPKLGNLIQSKIENREYFYGIELSARSNSTLDYRKFAVLPLFTSLVWFGEYSGIQPIDDVDAVRFGSSLIHNTVVMPHFTCYRATPQRLKNFLSLNFTNVLALRGDLVDGDQDYKHASDLVTDIRKIRGDTISIGVGGYPQKHPQAKSMQDDLRYLTQKVDAGADFIITQICFDASSIIEFVGNCRKNGITVPIIVGVYVPENYRILLRMLQITQVTVPSEQLEHYKKLRSNTTEFKQYAVEMAGKFITEVFESNVDVYGVQFFSMNYFEAIEELVNNVIYKFNTKILQQHHQLMYTLREYIQIPQAPATAPPSSPATAAPPTTTKSEKKLSKYIKHQQQQQKQKEHFNYVVSSLCR
ncbi:5,10-methylenetetrahydrofolate reductase [Episyrphus balteatus]|uniref:5,10-methylenetetrahydrofolate reductase n=1 Tax=Episyrphus balteatus TaxID=286459 RepID=UPI0024853227|nr:5,10-methylenetetrahydrofolate reductase [Episyrphus balteatus]